MPRISAFYGITISMYFRDRAPPHFHAEFGGSKASFAIHDGRLLYGRMDPRARRLVETWRRLHEIELMADWKRATAGQSLNPIEPLGAARLMDMTARPPVLCITGMERRGPFELALRFNDGTAKRVDVAPILYGPVFEPLKNAAHFALVTLDEQLGTVVWPNGADFAPEALHALPDLG